jgi:hypothetical protein
MNEIIVSTLYCIKPAMGEAIHRDNIKYGYIIGQYFIQPEKQVEIPILFYIDMKKELCRVYLRVRSPAANNRDRRFQYFTKCCFQNFLHTQYPGMLLPSAVMRPVITYVKKVPQCISLYLFWRQVESNGIMLKMAFVRAIAKWLVSRKPAAAD